jgi:Domain of unknown function (DUF4440)
VKRCPTCNKSFTDPNLSFCIDDGTPLVKADAPAYDPEATLVSPSPSVNESSSEVTQTYGQGEAPSDWKGPVYQPPGSFVRQPQTRKPRVWPWIVGILVLLLVVGGIGIGAVIFITIMRPAQRENENPSSNSNPERNDGNRNSNANTNGNSNSSVTNTNENANTSTNLNSNSKPADGSQPPTNEDQVLSDLTDIENEWSAANINADKKKLQRILADDYVGTNLDGTMQGKADYIRDIKPDPSIKHWDFDNLKLSLKRDRATLSGTVTLEVEGHDDVVLRFTDKFVWRDARWQAVGSEVSRVK